MGGTVAGEAPRPSCRWPALISPALLGFALLVFYTNVGQPPHAESEQDTRLRYTEKQCRCAQMVFQRGGKDITATCANPDNDPDGDWCFVEDETCQGAPWGYCAAPALADALAFVDKCSSPTQLAELAAALEKRQAALQELTRAASPPPPSPTEPPVAQGQGKHNLLQLKEACTVLDVHPGRPCVFPFEYLNATFRTCTNVDADGGRPWCSTQTDEAGRHVTGQWGHCESHCRTGCGLKRVCGEETSQGACQGTYQNRVLAYTDTADGRRIRACVFPFRLDGQTHRSCVVIEGDPKPFCSIQTDERGNHIPGQWAYCHPGQ